MALMDESGSLREDLNIPKEERLKVINVKIKEILKEGKMGCQVVIVSEIGNEKLLSISD